MLAEVETGYCMAKGSSSTCNGSAIDKGELRVGWLNSETGTYGGWVRLRCWRVPNRVWLGLPNPDKCREVSLRSAVQKLQLPPAPPYGAPGPARPKPRGARCSNS